MNRKKFFRNLLGATAAVTVGKYLPVPSEVPKVIPPAIIASMDGPGILPGAFKVFFKKGWFHKNDLLKTRTEHYIIAEEHSDRLVCLNVNDLSKPNLEIYFTPELVAHTCDEVVLIGSAMPEEYEPDKER